MPPPRVQPSNDQSNRQSTDSSESATSSSESSYVNTTAINANGSAQGSNGGQDASSIRPAVPPRVAHVLPPAHSNVSHQYQRNEVCSKDHYFQLLQPISKPFSHPTRHT